MKFKLSSYISISTLQKALMIGLMDLFAIAACFFAALWLRFDFKFAAITPVYLHGYLIHVPIWCVISVIVFIFVRLYNSIWLFVSTSEFFRIMGAYGVLGVLGTAYVLLTKMNMPRSFYVIGFIFSFFCTIGIRFSYRLMRLVAKFFTDHAANTKSENIMLIGAGEAGRVIANEMANVSPAQGRIVCAIDDNPVKLNKRLCGIPILGGRDMIPEAAKKYEIDKIIVAMPSEPPAVRKEILDICTQTGCVVQTLPGVYQLVNGEVSISQLRTVDVQDLLGREPIAVNNDEILSYVSGKVVMVTGGGGSIGSELCRQIARANPKLLIIFDIYENNAYDIQMELQRELPNLNLAVLIGSVRNTNRLEDIMETYRPELVFHAAAHKHVPLMEDSPNEAIKNNVFGTFKMARTAAKYGVKRFVLISTDKAVNPTNIMGASKRLCEMVVQMMSRQTKTEFVAVRFGNVLGSNGSVIPLFKKQIQSGGPVTVTHPDIIRYFMTIPEAVSLVLQAGYYAKGGEIFVLDMGEPVKIDTMARNLIRLSGFEPDVDIMIEYTGLRPGEKLYEELLMKEEGLQETDNKLIHIGKPIEMNDELFQKQLVLLEKACTSESAEIKDLVAKMVPTYKREGV